MNQHVNNGVTVVSHDAFVNARPVAQNMMRVDPREMAAAPVSHVVRAEPVRASVIGAGRPVSVRPPAAVISRPVVAVRTPPPPPRLDRAAAGAGRWTFESAGAGSSQSARRSPRRRIKAADRQTAGRLQTVHSAEQRQQSK